MNRAWASLVHRASIVKRVADWQQSPKDFLLHFQSGVYTCSRTIEGKIFNWDFHINRLVLGTFRQRDSTLSDKFMEEPEYIEISKRVENAFIRNLKVGMKDFSETFKDGNMRIYMVIENPGNSFTQCTEDDFMDYCWVYVQCLPERGANEIILTDVRVYERENPEVKSIEWVKAKKTLESELPKEKEEFILAGGSKKNELYEGLSSNFFLFKNDKLYVAPEGTILTGTVMQLVLQACSHLNIPVERKVPLIEDLDDCSGCFISSTSRMVLPINKMFFPDHPNHIPEMVFEVPDKIKDIANYVRKELITASTDILSK